MKQHASLPKIASHVFLALVSGLLISLISGNHSWIKVTLFLAWGTFFLIDFLRLLLIGTRYSISGAYILFYLGILILAVSVTWLGNIFLKVILNPLFSSLAWEFQIGNLFSGLWQYVWSIPALLIGAALIISGALWENSAQYHEWHQSLFPKTPKKMFRREFTWEK